jgi:hypothetical protein
MWKLDKDGQCQVVKCDVCGKNAGIRILVANEVIAEACDEHAGEVRAKVKAMLVTKPGPPDVCGYQEAGKVSNPRCKADAGHEGDHVFK